MLISLFLHHHPIFTIPHFYQLCNEFTFYLFFILLTVSKNRPHRAYEDF